MRTETANLESPLTSKETAELLKVTEKHLIALRRAGKQPRYFRVGRSIRYPVESLREFMRGEANNTSQQV